jgi:hypothetical protein
MTPGRALGINRCILLPKMIPIQKRPVGITLLACLFLFIGFCKTISNPMSLLQNPSGKPIYEWGFRTLE